MIKLSTLLLMIFISVFPKVGYSSQPVPDGCRIRYSWGGNYVYPNKYRTEEQAAAHVSRWFKGYFNDGAGGDWENCSEYSFVKISEDNTHRSYYLKGKYYDGSYISSEYEASASCRHVATQEYTRVSYTSSVHSNIKDLICNIPDEEDGDPPCPTGNPVNTLTGNKFQRDVDVSSGSLVVSRSYNSNQKQWRFNHFPALKIYPTILNGERVVVAGITLEDGRLVLFRREGLDSSYVPIRPGAGALYKDQEPLAFTYDSPDSVKYHFNSGLKIDELYSLEPSKKIFYEYDGDSIIVSDNAGDSIIYTKDDAGRIVSVVDKSNNVVEYIYDDLSNLSEVYVNNKLLYLYHYEDVSDPMLLTGITDANNDRYTAWSYDSEGRAISSSHGVLADNYTLDFQFSDDVDDPRVIQTNPHGRETIYHFKEYKGIRKLVQVEGVASENCQASNRLIERDLNGFIVSVTGNEGSVTTYVRDSLGRELSRTEAEGTPDARTITTEWHSEYNVPVKVTTPESVTNFTYDSSGQLLSKQVVPVTE